MRTEHSVGPEDTWGAWGTAQLASALGNLDIDQDELNKAAFWGASPQAIAQAIQMAHQKEMALRGQQQEFGRNQLAAGASMSNAWTNAQSKALEGGLDRQLKRDLSADTDARYDRWYQQQQQRWNQDRGQKTELAQQRLDQQQRDLEERNRRAEEMNQLRRDMQTQNLQMRQYLGEGRLDRPDQPRFPTDQQLGAARAMAKAQNPGLKGPALEQAALQYYQNATARPPRQQGLSPMDIWEDTQKQRQQKELEPFLTDADREARTDPLTARIQQRFPQATPEQIAAIRAKIMAGGMGAQ